MLGERDVHIVLFNNFFNIILLSTRIKVDLDLTGKIHKGKKKVQEIITIGAVKETEQKIVGVILDSSLFHAPNTQSTDLKILLLKLTDQNFPLLSSYLFIMLFRGLHQNLNPSPQFRKPCIIWAPVCFFSIVSCHPQIQPLWSFMPFLLLLRAEPTPVLQPSLLMVVFNKEEVRSHDREKFGNIWGICLAV